MPFTLTMPKLSPTMEEGTIAKWRKKEGEFVKEGEVIFEVATDKATVEHSVLDSGYLRKILIPEGGEAVVNQPVAIFTEKAEESIEGYQVEGVKPKATEEIPSPEVAAVTPAAAQPKAAAGGGMQQPSFIPEPPLADYRFPFPSEPAVGRVRSTPLARKIAQEKGIELTSIKGSGPHGRVVSKDLPVGQPKSGVVFGQKPLPTIPPGSFREESLTPMRKVIGQRLQESKTFIPHFYVSQEIIADPLIQARSQLLEVGIKVSFNDFIVRAAALALKEHPEINSGFNSVKNAIIRFQTIDISVAVSVPAGLITPILRYADHKNLGQISVEIRELARRAKEGKLARGEYVGGSFTISNLGMYGVSSFAGIINPPQAAILCVGGIEERPVVQNKSVVVGHTLTLTLAADHRVVDGAEGAKFLKTLQKYLLNPTSLVV